MNKKPHAFIRRSSAVCAAAALALSGAFIAVPANAAPEKDTTATTAPATVAPETQAPATEGAVIDDPALVEAIKRDLGMTVEEFVAAGELGTKAADAVKELSAIEGYEGIALVDSKKVVVSGTGEALKAAVDKLGFEFKDTAAKKAELKPVETKKPVEKTEPKEALKAQPTADLGLIMKKFIALYGAENLTSVVNTQVDGQSAIVIRAKSGLQPKTSQAPADVQRAVTGAAVNPTPEEFAASVGALVTFEDNGPAAPVYDLTNGQGYFAEGNGSGSLCSVGFNGYDKSGAPAIISAGHCTNDGSLTVMSLTDPEGDYTSYADAGYPAGPETPLPAGDVVVANAAGETFNQFGGPGNTPAEIPEDAQTWDEVTNIGTDVSTWEVTSDEVNPLAETTKWSDPSDLTSDAVKITNVRAAVVGDNVCKSGRTTSWTCGPVTEVGPFIVGGFNTSDPNGDPRAVKGFTADFSSDRDGYPGIWGGDSGGSMIAGNSAVGITSARDTTNRTTGFGADLQEALAVTDGYSVKLFVNTPTLVDPENNGSVQQGGTITGAVEGDVEKVVIKSAGAEDQYVAVTDGKWTIKAPNSSGKYNFTAQAINGFNKSAVADFTVDVKAAPMDKPAITSPKDGETFGRVLAYYGTGTPGATVELKGAGIDGTVTVTVDADGKWSYQVEGGVPFSNDAQKIEARQAAKGDRAASEWVSSSFFVKPGPVTITNPGGGAKYDQGTASIKIEGTASVDGEVRVGFDGGAAAMFEVKDGKWTASLPAKDLAAGTYDIVASQTVDGVAAPEARVGIEIVAPAPTETPKPTEEPTAPPTESPKPTDQPTTSPSPQPTCETEVVVEIGPDGKPTAKAIPVDPNCDNNGDGLPDTGANEMTMPLVFAGSALLLAGAGAVAFTAIRRRKAQH